ncbi:sodium-dependent glucose transporter 1C-like [Thomomys bottae]
MGISASILGPTFQDLATNVNRNISSLSEIFVGRALGYLCGSVIGGILFDCMNHFLLLGLSIWSIAVSSYLIPFCKTAVLLNVMMSATGVSYGVLDTGGNVLILAIWGDKSPPHMQALHFSFALGAFLAPLLAKLALGPSGSADNHTEPGLLPPALNRSSEAASVSLLGFPHDMNLLWAYASTGTYILLVSLFFFALFFMKSSRQGKSTASAQVLRRAKHHKALLCLLFMFFFFYVGAEVTYGSYIFSFATSHVGMDEREAAGLNSIFWGTFAACRGLAIFFAACLRPATMIVLSNVGSLASCLFLVLFDKSPLCLWIASSVFGASMAPMFPSGISWIEQYTTISGKSTAFILVGAALGLMATPALAGILQGQYPDLPVVLYACFVSAIFTTVLFPMMYKVATLPLRKGNRKVKNRSRRVAVGVVKNLDSTTGPRGNAYAFCHNQKENQVFPRYNEDLYISSHWAQRCPRTSGASGADFGWPTTVPCPSPCALRGGETPEPGLPRPRRKPQVKWSLTRSRRWERRKSRITPHVRGRGGSRFWGVQVPAGGPRWSSAPGTRAAPLAPLGGTRASRAQLRLGTVHGAGVDGGAARPPRGGEVGTGEAAVPRPHFRPPPPGAPCAGVCGPGRGDAEAGRRPRSSGQRGRRGPG